MKKKTVVIGGGGHARSVMDMALSSPGLEIVGCLDPHAKEVLDVPVIGRDEDLDQLYAAGVRHAFVALGDNALRRKLYRVLKEKGFELVNIISENAVVSPRAELGQGICVMVGAVVNVNTVIGDNCIINTNCNIDHDCNIGAHCHIAPGVAMSGMVEVGAGTHIGTGAAVIDGITIGEWSYIGAGAAVVKDIPPRVLAYGVPARVIRKLGEK